MVTDYLPVDWKNYTSLAQKLASSLIAHTSKIDHIVAISRGGLTLGHLLSDFLRIPIATISIQSYTDIQKQGEIKITTKLNSPIKNQHILLVDDVADSGKTLTRATLYLKTMKPKKITSVTMFYKPHSIFRPDYFAQITTKWILFPFESTEMIILITKNLEKEGKSKAYIQHFLEKLHYTEEQIKFVRRHYFS